MHNSFTNCSTNLHPLKIYLRRIQLYRESSKMTILAAHRSPGLAGGGNRAIDPAAIKPEMQVSSTPQKRRLRSDSSPAKQKSPRRRLNDSPSRTAKGTAENITDKALEMSISPVKLKLLQSFIEKPNWNPRDIKQLNAAKEALHVSTAPSTIVCRDVEGNRILEFCKQCVEQEKAGSLYVCGCPGTGKSLSIEKVKEALIDWAKKADFQPPNVLSINCTSLTKTSEIFNKILEKIQPKKKLSGLTTPLQLLQNLFSVKLQASTNMTLVIVDELDYLITKDRAVLHELFMLTSYPFSRCIILGIANAIDLAD